VLGASAAAMLEVHCVGDWCMCASIGVTTMIAANWFCWETLALVFAFHVLGRPQRCLFSSACVLCHALAGLAGDVWLSWCMPGSFLVLHMLC
jgi:hypothetical protein